MRTSKTNQNLSTKTVVITGATSGAGRAIAIEFAKHGAKLVLAARSLQTLKGIEEECDELGAITLCVPTDVTDHLQVQQLAKKTYEYGGNIDVWVNNAGVLAAGTFEETPVEVHDQVVKTNLIGYMHGAHAAMFYFKQQQYGTLINNISVGGWFPVPYSAGYSASKFGIVGFSEALKGELTSYKNIHVCNMFPAFLDTPGIQHAANYTGRILRPAPPVYDPMKVARAAVSLAKNPKPSVTIGSVTTLLKLAHVFFPAFSRLITAKVIETYLQKAPATPETSGNLFSPAEYGTSIHGGWNLKADADTRKKAFEKAALVTGVAAGLLLLSRARNRTIKNKT